MTKKLIFVAVFGLICMYTIFSCSSSRRVQDTPPQEGQKMSVTGLVHSYGNVPFTWLGIETEDGKAYGLRIDKETDSELRKLFGVRVSIEGTLELPVRYGNEQLKDGAIHVENFEIAK